MGNPLFEKACAFADRILDMSDYLLEGDQTDGSEKKQKHIPYSVVVCVKQITRSGTSIMANVAEGQGVQSRADLTNKFSIAYKEAIETKCWLDRLKHRNVLTENQFASINADLEELTRILISSLNTLKNN